MMLCRSTLPLAPYKSSCAIRMVAVPRRGSSAVPDPRSPDAVEGVGHFTKSRASLHVYICMEEFPSQISLPIGTDVCQRADEKTFLSRGMGVSRAGAPEDTCVLPGSWSGGLGHCSLGWWSLTGTWGRACWVQVATCSAGILASTALCSSMAVQAPGAHEPAA